MPEGSRVDMASPELDSLLAVLDQTSTQAFDLYVDQLLISLLSAVAPYSVLKQHGVRTIVPLTEQSANMTRSSTTAVFITTAEPVSLALVSRTVAKLSIEGDKFRDSNSTPLHTVIVVPEVSPSVELLFADYGVLGDIQIKTWQGILSSDPSVPGILSCFLPNGVDNDSSTWMLAWALNQLQANSTGLFGKTTGVGPRGSLIMRLLNDLGAQNAIKQQQERLGNATDSAGISEGPSESAFQYHFGYSSGVFSGEEVEHAIIIDRNLDLVTPMLMQTTYAGVLDETLGISSSGVTGSKLPGCEKVQLRNDAFFGGIANKAFGEACDDVYGNAKQLQQDFQIDSRTIDKENASVSEFREIVQKLGSLENTKRLVQAHTELATTAMAELDTFLFKEIYDLQLQMLENRIANTQAIARIQDLVFQMAPLPWILRLISLLSLLRDGIKEQVLQNLFNGDICRTYGYQHLQDIEGLYNKGLVFSPKGSSFLLSTPSFASFVSGNTGSYNPTNDKISGNSSSTAGNSQLLDMPLSQQYTWYTLNKSYKLFPDEARESMPYAGYVPLTARITQLALGIIPLAKTPLYPEFTTQVATAEDREAWRESKLRRTLIHNTVGHEKPVILVAIAGGVTYAEAEAIRLSVEAGNRERRVIVVSTSLITGEDIVKA